MNRMPARLYSRRYLLASGWAAMATSWPSAAAGQQSRIPVVGVIRLSSEEIVRFAEPFRAFMKEFGWEEGRNIRFDLVSAGGRNDQLSVITREFVARRVDVLVTAGSPATEAARRATSTIPIVSLGSDLVREGIVQSMARPGGNVTGVSILGIDLDAKRLELLHGLVPRARRVGVLVDPTAADRRPQMENAAKFLDLELVFFPANDSDEIARAMDHMAAANVEAVSVLSSPILNAARALIIEKTKVAKMPAIYQWPETATEGGLLSYGPPWSHILQLVASYVDKILRGARPGDLPVVQPTKIELVINLKTAKQLGLTIPPSIMVRADEVIE
jgi:putative ABC transport system substrate-binding protein